MNFQRIAPRSTSWLWVTLSTVGVCATGTVILYGKAAGRRGAATHVDDYADQKKIDPVAVNGAIFVDWPRPDVLLVFSGEQDGYLEPCGCAGLENQKGGFRRRATLFNELRNKGWPIVAL